MLDDFSYANPSISNRVLEHFARVGEVTLSPNKSVPPRHLLLPESSTWWGVAVGTYRQIANVWPTDHVKVIASNGEDLD